MDLLAGTCVIVHSDSWIASLNMLQKLKSMGIYFVGLIKLHTLAYPCSGFKVSLQLLQLVVS